MSDHHHNQVMMVFSHKEQMMVIHYRLHYSLELEIICMHTHPQLVNELVRCSVTVTVGEKNCLEIINLTPGIEPLRLMIEVVSIPGIFVCEETT